ncbi:basic leucine zipper 23-like [Rutidosis leptorrhynchoides]|uniref:basic leucine zipper 23-like n=1 Tax=Rutidosis leptorrhynchoides TaxID=125765 RepID=UPI003A98F30C
MDDGKVELSDHGLLPNPDNSTSVDSFLDNFFNNSQQTCTHTHKCNPPGPDSAHTHTCYHTHTRVITSEEEDNHSNSSKGKAKRPSGNREAVRKYREKKKAQSVFLEEEVKKLRVMNQQLVRKLQRQTILEAENLRLRSLLADFRGKIDNEIGSFPFQNQCIGDCSVVVQDCIGGNGKMVVPWEANCHPAVIDCRASINDIEGHSIDSVETLDGDFILGFRRNFTEYGTLE